jgi:hypothetical protein
MKIAGRICCWNNCTETAPGDLPQGWVNLFVYESPQPTSKIFERKNWHKHRHDGVLCAQHAFMLERMLRPLPATAGEGVVVVPAPEPSKTPPTVN